MTPEFVIVFVTIGALTREETIVVGGGGGITCWEGETRTGGADP